MQNREMIMHKVGKWFMIIGIAGLLSLFFIEWSRWNLVPLAEKINLVAVSENYHEFHTEFIEGGIATFSIFALFAAPSLVRWDSRSAINVTLLLFAIVIDAAAIISVIAKGEISCYSIINVHLCKKCLRNDTKVVSLDYDRIRRESL